MFGCPHGTNQLPLNRFSWNFVFGYFSKICQESSHFIKIWWVAGTVHEDLFAFMISCSVLLWMRSALDKSCRENQNIHFMFCNCIENCAVYETVERYGRARQATADIMWCVLFTCWITMATISNSEYSCNTYCLYTTRMLHRHASVLCCMYRIFSNLIRTLLTVLEG
jgi:hypothetical protein